MVFGENGVVIKAQNSKIRTETESVKEAVDMALGAMTSEFMGDIWPSNTGANIGDWATVGKFKEEIENNGYEVDVTGISNIDSALLKDNNELNIYKEGSSANKSTFVISESSDGTSLEGEIAIWTQTGTSVTNGTVNLTVGQAVTGYSVTVGETTYGDTKWNVLGAKDGKLLITTNANITTQRLLGRSGYLSGISTLNTAVAGYINTTLGDSVRTIDVDDINRVTGYNPEVANYGSEKIYAYGNEVTYYWKGDEYPYYSGSNNVKDSLTIIHNNFYYPDASASDGWASPAKLTSTSTPQATADNNVEITTLTSNYYKYTGSKYLTSSTDAYTLLFKEGNSDSIYWLGSQFVKCNINCVEFGLRLVYSGYVGDYLLMDSTGEESSISHAGIRPVVSLKSEVNVTSAGAISID